MAEKEFINAGFTVVGTENNENKLLSFLKENYPNVIRDTEINIEELKAVLGLPIDEKVNGYGLNFVGRNFARAKYAQKTEKELRLNSSFSKDLDATQNLVLKGDNLDSLKILKNHYSGKIKCIYIDPPYNTANDEFVYPDKFDKEEAEVLGLANLSESDFARMDFSFKTKKSHNGWLAFMYPRLLLARDLLSKDGVIFISIDDNEQANLKLLCDDVFGEENMVAVVPRIAKRTSDKGTYFRPTKDYILVYAKNVNDLSEFGIEKKRDENDYKFVETDGRKYKQSGASLYQPSLDSRPNQRYYIQAPDGSLIIPPGNIFPEIKEDGSKIKPLTNNDKVWRWSVDTYLKQKHLLIFTKGSLQNPLLDENGNQSKWNIYPKVYFDEDVASTLHPEDVIYDFPNSQSTKELNDLGIPFTFAKPSNLVKYLLKLTTFNDDIILDFFAGSGTTAHAVMQLNVEDGGNRKFILCQIDEPIKEDKPAYKFCIENNLPPVISSITIERLKRAGEKIAKEIEEENKKTGMFDEHKKQGPDIGFKVFDSVEAPKLKVDETGQILITENETDALSRIYNMIFTVGLDEPTQVPEEVVKDSIYKIGNHYYITNSEKITSDDYSNAIKNGKVFIDGWTASLNGTLQNYKEDVKIVF
jgi:adenine-specific DNA-methyltransferase